MDLFFYETETNQSCEEANSDGKDIIFKFYRAIQSKRDEDKKKTHATRREIKIIILEHE